MSVSPLTADPHQVIARIDAIIRELEALRQQVGILAPPTLQTTTHGLTEELFGAAGHGAWEEYDLNLDWVRFSQ